MSKNTKIGIGVLVAVVLVGAIFALQGGLFKGTFKFNLPAKIPKSKQQQVPPRPAQNQECRGPYHVVAPDGRCVWSCTVGTTPDNETGECKCKPGYTQTNFDPLGRRNCALQAEPPAAATPSALRVTGGRVNGDCTTSCVRSANDEILQLEFTAEGSAQPQLRPSLQANDEADNNVPGDNWVGSGTISVDSNWRNIVDGDAAIQSRGSRHSLYFDFGNRHDLSQYSKASFIIMNLAGSPATYTFRACSTLIAIGDASDTCQQLIPIRGSIPAGKNIVNMDLAGLNSSTRYIGIESLNDNPGVTNIDAFRLYNDSITLNLLGSLARNAIDGIPIYGLPVKMEDVSGRVIGVGYIDIKSVSQAQAVIIPGADIGNAPARESPASAVSLASNQYKFAASTADLLAQDTRAAESLAVMVDLRSDIQWYDAHSDTGVNGAEGLSPITASYSY